MDQSPHKVAHVIEQNGERVIVDPQESINSVMLWFYLLINVGACFGIPTSYLAKIVGYWAAYLTVLWGDWPAIGDRVADGACLGKSLSRKGAHQGIFYGI